MNKEDFKFLGCSFGMCMFILVVVVVLFIVGLALRPTILNLITKQNQASFEYTTTIQETLTNMHSEWLKLDAEIKSINNLEAINAKKALQLALVTEMKMKAKRISYDLIPPDISLFLATH